MPMRIAILAKAPQAGRCNKRLIPRLGAGGAARLQAQLLRRAARNAAASGQPVTLWVTPDLRHPSFLALRRAGLRLRRQPAGDLGRRMLWAARGGATVLLGTDAPALGAARIRALAEATAPAALHPAPDGGFVALRLPRAQPRLFAAVDWGSPRVLRQLRRNARRVPGPLQWREAVPDLDTPADFRALRRAGVLGPLCLWRVD